MMLPKNDLKMTFLREQFRKYLFLRGQFRKYVFEEAILKMSFLRKQI